MPVAELIETEAELKERLHRRIDSMHDVDELRSLFAYIDEYDVYELTPEEEKMLDEAEKSPCISAEEANRRTCEFLRSLCQNSD